MIEYSEALKILKQAAESETANLYAERVALDDSLGRIAAKRVVSMETVPPYANSAMDGFAIHSKWTEGASADDPKRFPVLGLIVAGDAPIQLECGPRSSQQPGVFEIMTGAPFPTGPERFDATIKIEDVLVKRNAEGSAIEIEIKEAATEWQNYRDAGEDFQIGTEVLRPSVRIESQHIISLASLGVSELEVQRRPRIALISTGRELAPLGQALKPGQIRNSSAHFLIAASKQLGADCRYYGVIADDTKEFARTMASALTEKPDLIITTGAVSMGIHDFIGASLKELGAKIVFHKVAIRPGKPILFARFKKGPAVFGLPGNPVSTIVGMKFFVEPYLRALQGRAQEIPIRARFQSAGRTTKKPPGLRCFYKARLTLSEGEPQVAALAEQMSFMVRPLLEANAWAVFSEPGNQIADQEWVDVYPVEGFRL
jgi:molybdopterin molybdotransferase